MSQTQETWEWKPSLTRRQADGFQLRSPGLRKPSQVYDRNAVQEFLSGKIDREEMLRRIRR